MVTIRSMAPWSGGSPAASRADLDVGSERSRVTRSLSPMRQHYEPGGRRQTDTSGDGGAEPPQPQAVGHDEDAGERHRGTGEHRVEQPGGGEGQRGDVVGEGP